MWQSPHASVTFAKTNMDIHRVCMTLRLIADPTRVGPIARAAVVPQHAASEAARQKERHYSGRPRQDTFIPIAIETYVALLSQTYEFLRDCAPALGEHFPSTADHPSTSVLVTWFRQRIAVKLQGAQARGDFIFTIYIPPPARAVISAGDLMAIVVNHTFVR